MPCNVLLRDSWQVILLSSTVITCVSHKIIINAPCIIGCGEKFDRKLMQKVLVQTQDNLQKLKLGHEILQCELISKIVTKIPALCSVR